MTHTNRKKFDVLKYRTGCSLLWAEGFSCSLDIYYEDLGISKLQLMIKKIHIFFIRKFLKEFLVIRTLGPGPQCSDLKCWIRIHVETYADPQQ
jgi:hypothetical protein